MLSLGEVLAHQVIEHVMTGMNIGRIRWHRNQSQLILDFNVATIATQRRELPDSFWASTLRMESASSGAARKGSETYDDAFCTKLPGTRGC